MSVYGCGFGFGFQDLFLCVYGSVHVSASAMETRGFWNYRWRSVDKHVYNLLGLGD